MDTFLASKALSLPDPHNGRAHCLALAEKLDGWSRSRWAKALRACGRLIAEEARMPGRPLRLSCNLKICPICQLRRQKRLFTAIRPRVVHLLGACGTVAPITLTGPHGQPLQTRMRDMLSVVRSFSRRQEWKKAGGLSRQVGVVWAFELEPGTDGKGHPHIHQIVVAADTGAASRYRDAIYEHWAGRVPGFHPAAEFAPFLSSDPAEWGPRLHYLLKGPGLRPEWPAEVFDEAVLEFTSGRHHFAALGLLSHGRGRPSQNPSERRSVTPK